MWRSGSGPFLPYVRSTPFVSLARYPAEMELLPPEPAGAADAPPTGEGELLVVDLPGARATLTGVALWRERRLWPVTTLSHWHHPHGIVGDDATAGALLLSRLVPGDPVGWTLLLDSTRYSDQPLTADRFNNQYELTEDDLPTADELRNAGMNGICIWTDGAPKEDIRRYGAYLAEAQLAVRWHT